MKDDVLGQPRLPVRAARTHCYSSALSHGGCGLVRFSEKEIQLRGQEGTGRLNRREEMLVFILKTICQIFTRINPSRSIEIANKSGMSFLPIPLQRCQGVLSLCKMICKVSMFFFLNQTTYPTCHAIMTP